MNRKLYEQMRKFFDFPFVTNDYTSIQAISCVYLATDENEAAAQELVNWYATYRPRLKCRIIHTGTEVTLEISRKK